MIWISKTAKNPWYEPDFWVVSGTFGNQSGSRIVDRDGNQYYAVSETGATCTAPVSGSGYLGWIVTADDDPVTFLEGVGAMFTGTYYYLSGGVMVSGRRAAFVAGLDSSGFCASASTGLTVKMVQ